MATTLQTPHSQAAFRNLCVTTVKPNDNTSFTQNQEMEGSEESLQWQIINDQNYIDNLLSNNKADASMQVDLSHLSDSEFYERLTALRIEHKKTLDLYSKMYNEMRSNTSRVDEQETIEPKILRTSSSFNSRPPTGRTSTNRHRVASPVENFRWKLMPTKSTVEYDEENNQEMNRHRRARSLTPDGRRRRQDLTKSLIDNMWTDFSISNQVPKKLSRSSSFSRLSSTGSSPSETIKKQKDAKLNSWRHRVTIPKPFNLTESKNVKTTAMKELEEARIEKLRQEEAECHKKFKAAPVPAHIYIPLFDEIMEEKETKRRMWRDHCYSLSKSREKPFNFIKREEKRMLHRHDLHKCLNGEGKRKFEAKPFPKEIFDKDYEQRQREEEEYKKILKSMRAKQLLMESSLPSNMQQNRQYDNKIDRNKLQEKAKKLGISNETNFKPKISKRVPNFDKIHRSSRIDGRQYKPTTICEPFNLSASQNVCNRHRQIDLTDMDNHQYRPSSTIRLVQSTSLDAIPCRLTSSFEKRLALVEKTKENRSKLSSSNSNRNSTIDKKKIHETYMKPSTDDKKSKLDRLRAEDRQRTLEYRRQIREMNEKLSENRSCLFERVSIKNAKMTAERKFDRQLQRHGLNMEQVEKKANKLEEHNTNEELVLREGGSAINSESDEDSNYDYSQHVEEKPLNSESSMSSRKSSIKSEIENTDVNNELEA